MSRPGSRCSPGPRPIRRSCRCESAPCRRRSRRPLCPARAGRVGSSLDRAGRLDPEHRDPERPHAAAHVRVGVVEPERPDPDQDVAVSRYGIGKLLDPQARRVRRARSSLSLSPSPARWPLPPNRSQLHGMTDDCSRTRRKAEEVAHGAGFTPGRRKPRRRSSAAPRFPGFVLPTTISPIPVAISWVAFAAGSMWSGISPRSLRVAQRALGVALQPRHVTADQPADLESSAASSIVELTIRQPIRPSGLSRSRSTHRSTPAARRTPRRACSSAPIFSGTTSFEYSRSDPRNSSRLPPGNAL